MPGSGAFVRQGAMPVAVQNTLVGRGGVQGLDDESHRNRKQLFLSIVPVRIGIQFTARSLRLL